MNIGLIFLLLSCSIVAQSEPLYLMVLGGYNVANYGEPYNTNNSHNSPNTSAIKYLYAPDSNSSNYYWTNPTDTLIGVPGNGSSYWNYLVHMIHNHTQEYVYLMVHSLPDGDIDDWLKDEWMKSVHQFVFGNQTANVTVLWIEGENDNDSGFWWNKGYISKWESLFESSRKLGNYQWGLAISVYSPYNYYFDEQTVRNDLSDLLSDSKNLTIFGGVDSDTLCQDYRYKYAYFNHVGQRQLASAWNNSIFNRTKNFVNANPKSNSYCDMRIFSLLTALIILAEILLPFLIFSLCCSLCCVGFYYHNHRQAQNHYYYDLSYYQRQQKCNGFSNDVLPKYSEKEPLLNPDSKA
jgi:hypothetical protein